MRASSFIGIAMAIVLGFGMLGAGSAFAATDAANQAPEAIQDAALTTAATKASKPAKPSKKQLKAFKKASADFSLELFNRCVAAKGKNANVTIAPMSVMTALAVTANGAGGKTAKQMRKVLGDGATIAQINKDLQWYNSKLVNTKKAQISSANAIWYDNQGSLKMKKAFLKAAQKYYNAAVSPSDFSDPATVDEVNSWVAEHTNNMIKRVIEQLDPADRVAIVNALYFDAEWRVPYDASDSNEAVFTAGNGKKRKVKMMYGTEQKYIEGNGVTGFIKPYAKGYSYVALLPDKGVSLKKFVSKLDGDAFCKLISGATKETVKTALPKYSLSYTNDEMEQQLIAMGMPRAFARNANFTKMGTDSSGNLYLGSVVHKTKIDVDERGTKAAAVTAVVAKANSALIDVKTVRLDRPFVYAIIDNTTKLPVFIGTVNDVK